MAFMRTTRDIDLLIKKEDLNKCTAILKQIGWVIGSAGRDGELINNLIEQQAYTYKKADVVIELDLHLAAISDIYSNIDSFTKHIRDGAIVLNSAEGLIVPSPEGRLLITIANVYKIHNWLDGHYCKYIFDAACILNAMDQAKIDKCIDDGRRLLGLGDKIEQVMDIVAEVKTSINGVKTLHKEEVKSKAVFFTVNDGLLKGFKRLNIIIGLFNTWISGRNMLRIPLYVIFKFLEKLLVNPIIKMKKSFIKSDGVEIVKAKRINRTRWSFSKPS